MATLTLPTAEATRAWGEALAPLLRAGDLVVLTGDLGAGKTTLTQGIGAGLHVRGQVASPTFIIAREHPPLPREDGTRGPWLVHVDAYRLRSLDEVESLQIVEPLVIRMRTQGAREQSTAHLDNLWRRIQRIEPAQRLREVDRYLRMHRESAQHVVGGLKPDLESLRPVIKSSLFLEGVRQQMRPAREAV